MNYKDKASRVMTEVQSGCVCGETIKWVVKRLRYLTGKKEPEPRGAA